MSSSKPQYDLAVLRSCVSIPDVLRDAGYQAPTRGTRMACPLCDGENRQAFSIHGEYWRCFRCHEHGDAVTLAMKLHRIPFKSTITRLAALAGLTTLPVLDQTIADTRARQREQERQQRRDRNRELLAIADEYRELEKTARAVGVLLARDTDNGAVWDALGGLYRRRDAVEQE